MSALALHGFTQTPAQWNGIFEADIAAPWLLGHGPAPDCSARSWDDAVDALLRSALKLPPPRLLVGYSMGARLALGALARDSSLFDRALLIGVQPGLVSTEEREARGAWEDQLMGLLEDQGLEAFLEEWEKLPLFADQKNDGAARIQAAERRKHTAQGLAHALSALGLRAMPNVWNALPAIGCPVELVVGARDAKFLAIAREMLLALRPARLHVVENSGHNPLLDAPDATHSLLRELAMIPSSR